jgi:hypothetical protein
MRQISPAKKRLKSLKPVSETEAIREFLCRSKGLLEDRCPFWHIFSKFNSKA